MVRGPDDTASKCCVVVFVEHEVRGATRSWPNILRFHDFVDRSGVSRQLHKACTMYLKKTPAIVFEHVLKFSSISQPQLVEWPRTFDPFDDRRCQSAECCTVSHSKAR